MKYSWSTTEADDVITITCTKRQFVDALAVQIDVLLSDYAGNESFLEDEAKDLERRVLAAARLEALDWIRELWDYKAFNYEMRHLAWCIVDQIEAKTQ